MTTLKPLWTKVQEWLRQVWMFLTEPRLALGETQRANYHLLAPIPSSVKSLPGVRPRSIKIEERLIYQFQIASRVDQSLREAKGQVIIEFPYDGRSYFPLSAIRTLDTLGSPIEALVGYVGFKAHSRTSYQVGTIHGQAMPVKVPVWIPVADVEKAVAESSLGVTRLEYDIQELSRSPVMVDVDLVDDSEIRDFLNLVNSTDSFTNSLRLQLKIRSDVGNISQSVKERLLRIVEKSARDAKEKLDELKSKHAGQSEEDFEESKAVVSERYQLFSTIYRQLKELAEQEARSFTAEAVSHIFEVEENRRSLRKEVQADLYKLRDFIERHLGGIQLSYFGIDWPYAEQVVAPEGNGADWYYNPENGRLETTNIRLSWNDEELLYESTLYLGMYRPAQQGVPVQARVVLETDKLLSGSQVQWLDLHERERKVRFEFKTVVDVEIEQLDLAEIFNRRFFYPQRRLVFDGVLPTLDRLRDAESIINDVGLTIDERSYETLSAADVEQGCYIKARLQKIGDPTRIWLILSGTVEKGTHTITYDKERQQIQRPIALGNTRVVLYAQVAGDDKQISMLFDRIQALLENRFTVFKAI